MTEPKRKAAKKFLIDLFKASERGVDQWQENFDLTPFDKPDIKILLKYGEEFRYVYRGREYMVCHFNHSSYYVILKNTKTENNFLVFEFNNN